MILVVCFMSCWLFQAPACRTTTTITTTRIRMSARTYAGNIQSTDLAISAKNNILKRALVLPHSGEKVTS